MNLSLKNILSILALVVVLASCTKDPELLNPAGESGSAIGVQKVFEVDTVVDSHDNPNGDLSEGITDDDDEDDDSETSKKITGK
jgi:hypothetical protein